MSRTKFFLFTVAFAFAFGGNTFSQSKIVAPVPAARPSAVVSPEVDVLPRPAIAQAEQSAEAPQTPRGFNLAFGNGNYLGIETEQVTTENLKSYGMRDAQGVGVVEVAKGSPAEKAGLQKDDVILRMDNEPVTSVRKLERLIDEAASEQTVHITISRRGAEQVLTVKLGHRQNTLGSVLIPQNREFAEPLIAPRALEPFEFNMPEGNFAYVLGSSRRIGVGTTKLTKQLADYFGVKDGGILVTSVDEKGPAAKAGIKAGDCITAVNGNKVDSVQGLVRELGRKKDGTVTVTVTRDKNSRTFDVTPEAGEIPGSFNFTDLPQIGEMTTPLITAPATQWPDTFVTPNVLLDTFAAPNVWLDTPQIAPAPNVLLIPGRPSKVLVP